MLARRIERVTGARARWVRGTVECDVRYSNKMCLVAPNTQRHALGGALQQPGVDTGVSELQAPQSQHTGPTSGYLYVQVHSAACVWILDGYML